MQSKPKIFVAENVKGMMTLGKGEVFKQIVQDFTAAGYTVYYKLLNAVEYGVPQIRERVILVGVRNDIDFEYKYPDPTHGYGKNGLQVLIRLFLCHEIVKSFGINLVLQFKPLDVKRRFIRLEHL